MKSPPRTTDPTQGTYRVVNAKPVKTPRDPMTCTLSNRPNPQLIAIIMELREMVRRERGMA